MRILNKYELLTRALCDQKYLKADLNKGEDYSRDLNKELKWNLICIMRICNEILEEVPDDKYGEDVDDRLKVEKILLKTEEEFDNLPEA